MKHKVILFTLSLCILQSAYLSADPIITFFVRPYPKISKKSLPEKILRKLHRPEKIAQYTIRKLQYDLDKKAPNGILATYAGFLTRSNSLGQITFPKKHLEPALTLIITNRVSPMIMAGNTVHHWQIAPDAQAKIYSLNRTTENDGLMYWHVKQIALPKNRILPTDSILIFAKAKSFFIPEGATQTKMKNSFELPTIYARSSLDISTNALRMLMYRQFFDSLKSDSKLIGKSIQLHQI